MLSSVLKAQPVDLDNDGLTIFAAASLSSVMPQLEMSWRRSQKGAEIQISYAASAILARQIEAGAPADVFVSANRQWIEYLQKRSTGFTSPAPLVHNALVLAAPCHASLRVSDSSDLAPFLSANRFAMADPAAAPAGAYAKTALEKLGIWSDVNANAAYAGNARMALLMIERAGLPGIIYRTDAEASDTTCPLFELPLAENDTVTYFAVGQAGNDESNRFIDWLRSPAAASIWQSNGFDTVPY
ncbi:MAG: molybdate ABC transporter substrate-binding protein [Kordiimonadaceae bacterium]|nr:molybdate ABC transporter substrate-binding protein [Kordiimonadaceae bacterium]MBO6569121.1 molybdate ABC transporter substrate-binding protein [Kordiimonadaceae bacterium]MBO6964596.1 molybdate ABC transporter substrate-binding protein [Kordiimonadaceae bacterium]